VQAAFDTMGNVGPADRISVLVDPGDREKLAVR
jgi:hypothetical protein